MKSISANFLDFEEVTSLYVVTLQLMGILPLKNRNYDFLITRIVYYSCVVSFFILIVLFISFGYNGFQQRVIGLDYICELVIVTGFVLRYFIVAYYRDKFLQLHVCCRDLWNNCSMDEHRTVYSFIRKIQLLFKCYAAINVLLCVFYSYTAYTTRLPPIRPNGTETRILPMRVLVNGMEPTRGYFAMFAMQTLLLALSLLGVLGVDTCVPFIIMFAVGFFRVLQDRLLSINDKQSSNEESSEVYEEFVACAKFHQNIYELCDKIKEFTGALFFLQILCTGYNLSLAGIKLAGSDPDRFRFISTFGMCLVELFVCQWTPDHLLNESEAVTTAAYFASLPAINRQCGKLLIIIIERAQRPVKIIAGGIVLMSIESLGSMITGACSFFTVLRSFNV